MRVRITATLLGAALLASCSSGGSGDTSAAGDSLTEADKSRIADEWRNCMADAGLEAEVQYNDGGLAISVGAGPGMSDEEMLAAEVDCDPILEELERGSSGPELSPEEEAELADANFLVADCLAEQGYVVTASEDGLDINGEDQAAGFDEAEFAQAEEDCFKEAVPELWEKYGPEGE